MLLPKVGVDNYAVLEMAVRVVTGDRWGAFKEGVKELGSMVERDDVRGKDEEGGEEVEEEENIPYLTKAAVTLSYAHLSAYLPSALFSSRCPSPESWGRVLRYVERYGILEESVEVGGEVLTTEEERVAKELWENDVEEGEEEDSEADSLSPSPPIPPIPSIYLSRASALILDDPSSLISPTLTLHLYSNQHNVNNIRHSCMGKKFHPRSPPPFNLIRNGEGASSSFRRLSIKCFCGVCEYEAGKEVGLEVMKEILEHYKSLERYEDALEVCGVMLSESPNEECGYVNRARVTGWMDVDGEGFRGRERLLKEVDERAGDWEGIKDAVRGKDMGGEAGKGGTEAIVPQPIILTAYLRV